MNNYVLIGQTPVPEPDLLTWARWFGDADRRVCETCVLDTARVSTVFLGTDHNFGRHGPPIVFETMVFWEDEGGYEQERCATWADAEAMHARMVREAGSWRAWAAYLKRQLTDSLSAARRDWRELILQVYTK